MSTNQKQSLIDKCICNIHAARCALIEPTFLKLARARHSPEYVSEYNPLVSVIIATYNRGQILTERTIPSILNQTYQNFEIVIVGDHCIDNTPELIKKMRDPRIRFLDLSKRGKYPKDPMNRWFVQGVKPRNKGLQMAKGAWLAWMSDDDVLLPHYFSTLLRFAQKGNFEFVSALYTCVEDGEIVIPLPFDFVPLVGGMPTWMYRSYLKFFKWNIHSWRRNWNRPCDADLLDRMLRAGVRTGYIDEIVTHLPAVQGTNTVGFQAQKILADKKKAP